MSEFKPITTQEEFEDRLKERLEQKERSIKKQFEGYTSPEDLEKLKKEHQDELNKYSNVDEEIEGYKKKIADYESDSVKTRIAMEMGIPMELKDRLKGKDEDEIREDAKILAGFSSSEAPLASSDTRDIKTENEQAYKKLLKGLEA